MKRIILLSTAAVALTACATLSEHDKTMHMAHSHAHAADCGHQSVAHNDHMDYLHDGHMHHKHENHVDEHIVAVSAMNPVAEAPASASRHSAHTHSQTETLHAMVPHGDHMDFLHDGHLHHVHADHIDEHGPL